MFNRLVSLLVALMTFVSGTSFPQAVNIVDTFTSAVFGAPYTRDSVKSDFLDEITDSDIAFIGSDKSVGVIDDMVLVILVPDITFRQKCSFVAQSGGVLIGWSAPADLYILKFVGIDPEDIEEKCEALMTIEGVEVALPCMAHQYAPQDTPNDPFTEGTIWAETMPRGSNWWLEVIGAREAWDYEYCFNKDITVGVIDAGFQLDHPDLQGRISFPSEKYAKLNIPDNHGTHVAGIIAAEKNNGVGIAGVCPYAKLMCVDAYPDTLQFWIPDVKILFGFIDSVKAGAKVCNFSIGSSNSIPIDSTERPALYNWFDAKVFSLVMASLLSDGYDFLVVQSAGNGNGDGSEHYAVDASQNGLFCAINRASVTTGTYSNVTKMDIINRIIVVGACENRGDAQLYLTSYSNVGNIVDLAAPGQDIFSCYTGSSWSLKSGTSMAAPIVTGVAALVWSVNPNFTGAEVKDILTDEESTAWLARKNDNYYFKDLDYRSIEIVSAKYAVEEAIARSHSVGRINARVCDEYGLPVSVYATVVESDGIVSTHTALDNGLLDFVTTVGSREITIYDASGIVVYHNDSLRVSEGATTTLGDVVYTYPLNK